MTLAGSEGIERLRRSLRQEASLEGLGGDGRRPSAVLLLLSDGPDGYPQVLLTKRTERVAYHRGEVCFVGGAFDFGDESLVATALREAQEEMGIAPGDVEVLGALDPEMPRTTPFIIQPFVGLLPSPYPFRPSPAEIAEVLMVPLAVIEDPTNFREEAWLREGALDRERYFAYGPHLIWGATARILWQFLSALEDPAPVLGGVYGG